MWGLIRAGLIAAGLAAFAGLGGCAPGDVQLNGKIFDAVGLGGSQQTGSIPKVAERAPLVVPPSLERLPQPGSTPGPVADGNFPVDPERSVDQKQAALIAEQTAYCKEHYDKQIALGNRVYADAAIGPMGRCGSSVLSVLGDENPLKKVEK